MKRPGVWAKTSNRRLIAALELQKADKKESAERVDEVQERVREMLREMRGE